MSLSPRTDRDQRIPKSPTGTAVAALLITLVAAVVIVLATGSAEALVPLASLVAASAAWAGTRHR